MVGSIMLVLEHKSSIKPVANYYRTNNIIFWSVARDKRFSDKKKRFFK